jgi:acyl-coenzyme A thioesterase PaaI-like protein
MANRQPNSRSCFVCGRDNPVGLRVSWDNHPDAGEIRGSVTIPEHFNGYPGVVHGGIVAALLDETAGRTTLLSGDFEDLMVTAKLEVLYRKPTPTATALTLVGRILRRSGYRAEAEAELKLPDGTVAARGTALLARPPAEITSSWEAERPYWKVDE